MKDKPKDKLFIVKKFIKAQNALEAIKKDKNHPVDDVYIDSAWSDKNQNLADAVGFRTPTSNEQE